MGNARCAPLLMLNYFPLPSSPSETSFLSPFCFHYPVIRNEQPECYGRSKGTEGARGCLVLLDGDGSQTWHEAVSLQGSCTEGYSCCCCRVIAPFLLLQLSLLNFSVCKGFLTPVPVQSCLATAGASKSWMCPPPARRSPCAPRGFRHGAFIDAVMRAMRAGWSLNLIL